jgi:hypothetical protein
MALRAASSGCAAPLASMARAPMRTSPGSSGSHSSEKLCQPQPRRGASAARVKLAPSSKVISSAATPP